eukprot:7187631-Alexandrium_andersonii.AAC.1
MWPRTLLLSEKAIQLQVVGVGTHSKRSGRERNLVGMLYPVHCSWLVALYAAKVFSCSSRPLMLPKRSRVART